MASLNWTGRALLYARTVRYLKPRQIGNQLARRLLPRRAPGPAPQPLAWRPRRSAAGPFLDPPAPRGLPPGQIAFVGQAREFSVARPDWRAADSPKLWRYNLHYFDFLHWPGFTAAEKAALISDWIGRVPAGSGDGWEPYPLSLRIVNWLKYFLADGRGALPEAWVASLARQLQALHGDVEHHLLANHLFKNAKALVFGGLAFEGPAADAWLRQGLALLLEEADAQFLADGGHVERSPMYHCIMLEDLLDVLNWAAAWPGRLDPAVLARLGGVAARATRFLAGILGGDGEIPMFNDSARGITRPAGDILGYAAAVLDTAVGWPDPPDGRVVPVNFPDSGYFGYRQGGDSLLFDCGPVGPDYQPGHAHCDTLSYELCLDARPVIVDSGVFDYEAGPFRHAIRSTAAHNTVEVDGEEQSEIWGAFRVARRARPLGAGLAALPDGLRLGGGHDGYARLPGRVLHERELTLRPPRDWRVTDRLTGRGPHRARSRLHLAPGLVARRLESPGSVAVEESGRTVLRVDAFGPVTLRLEEGWHCPEFSVKLRNTVLVYEWEGVLPAEFGYALSRPP